MQVITSKKHINRMRAFQDMPTLKQSLKDIANLISDNILKLQQNLCFMKNNYLTVTEIKVVE